MLGTRFQEWRWSVRHILKGQKWAQSYINSLNHPHRVHLIQKIRSHSPLNTALEIGCNAGPNLYLLAKQSPNLKCFGIDINSDAIGQGKKWLTEQHISNINLSVGRADKLSQFQDKSIDIVFTDATLLYIAPDKIKNVLKEMLRVARNAIVLHEFYISKKEGEPFIYFDAHWIYDYEKIMETMIPPIKPSVTKILSSSWEDKAWQKFGAMIDISL